MVSENDVIERRQTELLIEPTLHQNEELQLSPPSPLSEEILAAKNAEWQIRNLVESDLADVIRICCESFPLDYPEYWYKQVVQGKFISYGLFHEGYLTSILVAEIKCGRECDLEDRGLLCSDDGARVVYILSLAVRGEYRRHGIASLLLEYLIRLVDVQNPLPKLIFLHVLAENHAAINFYKQNGFHHFATLNAYYQINDVYHDGFTMVCYVSASKKRKAADEGGIGSFSRSLLATPKQLCNLLSAILFTPVRLALRYKPPFLRF